MARESSVSCWPRWFTGRLLVAWFLRLMLMYTLAACGSSRAPAPDGGLASRVVSGHYIRTVFLIVMENHNWKSIRGSSSAPYINAVLVPHASIADSYFNPASLHPSLPNYLWLEAGTNCFVGTGCIRDDSDPESHPIASTAHLVTLLSRAGRSWRSYFEDISGDNCPLGTHTLLSFPAENGLPFVGGNLYAPKHAPFLYFNDVTNNQSSRSATCISHVRPFSQFAADLHHNTIAQYNFLGPNLCNDMHSACPVFSDRIRQGDRWLSHVVPLIQSSSAYKRGGAIFITWDEGDGGDGPIGMIVLSPEAKGHGYVSHLHYTHSSTLRTIEEVFSVKPLLAGAARSNDLRDLFRRFP